MKIDGNTSLVIRGHFAKVCVEINLNKPLVRQFRMENAFKLDIRDCTPYVSPVDLTNTIMMLVLL